MNKMLTCIFFTLLTLIWLVAGMAQNLTPFQSLAFAQIAAGGGSELLLRKKPYGAHASEMPAFPAINQPRYFPPRTSNCTCLRPLMKRRQGS